MYETKKQETAAGESTPQHLWKKEVENFHMEARQNKLRGNYRNRSYFQG